MLQSTPTRDCTDTIDFPLVLQLHPQRFMETLSLRIPMFDDVLITGTSDDHLKTLDQVLIANYSSRCSRFTLESKRVPVWYQLLISETQNISCSATIKSLATTNRRKNLNYQEALPPINVSQLNSFL